MIVKIFILCDDDNRPYNFVTKIDEFIECFKVYKNKPIHNDLLNLFSSPVNELHKPSVYFIKHPTITMYVVYMELDNQDINELYVNWCFKPSINDLIIEQMYTLYDDIFIEFRANADVTEITQYDIQNISCWETYDQAYSYAHLNGLICDQFELNIYSVSRAKRQINIGCYFQKTITYDTQHDNTGIFSKCDDLIIRNILSYLPLQSLMFIRMVNKKFYQIIPDIDTIFKYVPKSHLHYHKNYIYTQSQSQYILNSDPIIAKIYNEAVGRDVPVEQYDYFNYLNILVQLRQWDTFDFIFTQCYCIDKFYCKTLLLTAAKNCDLDGLKQLHTYQIPFDYQNDNGHLYDKIIKNNRMDCLMFLQDKGWSIPDNTKHGWICDTVGNYGHLEMLKYLHKSGKDILWCDGQSTVRNGHLECLKYMIDIGLSCDEKLYYQCIVGGSRECRQYLDSINCPKCDDIDKWEQFWSKSIYQN